jgi:hypothetical protein
MALLLQFHFLSYGRHKPPSLYGRPLETGITAKDFIPKMYVAYVYICDYLSVTQSELGYEILVNLYL